MNKTVVIYRSVYGYTKTYAEMIAEELACDLREYSEITPEILLTYDTIIYGGGLYAVGINGINLIKKNYDKLKDKHLFVWATGSNPGDPEDLEAVWSHNFTDEMRKNIPMFYLRGGFDYNKLNGKHKIMMSLLKMKLKSMKNRTKNEDDLLKAYDAAEYHCNKENIRQLTDAVSGL